MKIALMHYHLNPGGVTGVIRQQIEALSEVAQTLILTGEPPPPEFPSVAVHVPGIGYDRKNNARLSAQDTVQAVLAAIKRIWPGGCDILHIHNPLLAKNARLLEIIDTLLQKGLRLLLQVHDLAEDGRPWSYFRDAAYPANCHYGVINARDYEILTDCGLSEAGLHKLPNPVTPLTDLPPPRATPSTVLYPVRAIRRKNIGEALLLSRYMAAECPLAITLPPHSPRDWKYYNQWRDYARRHQLNVMFEASRQFDFKSLVSSARCLLTTSITEGFGFAFLEPWTAGKAILGRRLDVCMDFESAGVALDHLYHSLNIPFSWIDRNLFAKRRQACFRSALTAYGAEPDRFEAAPAEAHSKNWRECDLIDFGMLDEFFQRQVIDRVLAKNASAEHLRQLNPWLSAFGESHFPRDRISRNRRVVEERYGIRTYRKRLAHTYQQVMETKVRHQIDKRRLLARFLNPGSFSLLKWCDHDGI